MNGPLPRPFPLGGTSVAEGRDRDVDGMVHEPPSLLVVREARGRSEPGRVGWYVRPGEVAQQGADAVQDLGRIIIVAQRDETVGRGGEPLLQGPIRVCQLLESAVQVLIAGGVRIRR